MQIKWRVVWQVTKGIGGTVSIAMRRQIQDQTSGCGSLECLGDLASGTGTGVEKLQGGCTIRNEALSILRPFSLVSVQVP